MDGGEQPLRVSGRPWSLRSAAASEPALAGDLHHSLDPLPALSVEQARAAGSALVVRAQVAEELRRLVRRGVGRVRVYRRVHDATIENRGRPIIGADPSISGGEGA